MGRQLLAMNVMWKYREQVTFAFHGTMCLVANCAMRQLSEYNKRFSEVFFAVLSDLVLKG
jgi:hypothetical protein